MKNEIEVIDGIRGEWRTVTLPEEVTVGQRVMYGRNQGKAEYEEPLISVDIFNYWKYVQAFFPLPLKPAERKVAKVRIISVDDDHWFCIDVFNASIVGYVVKSRKSAIRGAKRFCEAIGYEMELQK